MLRCPNCDYSLDPVEVHGQKVDVCGDCGGIWFEADELIEYVKQQIRKDKDIPSARLLIERAVVAPHRIPKIKRTCARGHGELKPINYGYDSNVFVDKCSECGGLFVDKSDLPLILSHIKSHPKYRKLGKLLMEHEQKIIEERQQAEPSLLAGVYTKVPIALVDNKRTFDFPFVTLMLIGINLVMLVVTININDATFYQVFGFGKEKMELSWGLLSLISSMFIHVNVIHGLGNMLYLWIFGDNIEDRLGHIPFLLFYLGSGIIASLGQMWWGANTDEVMIGASGAIAGLMGGYLILYPTVKIKTLFFNQIKEVPAVTFLGFWLLVQILPALRGDNDGVAWWAHVTGFIWGGMVMMILKQLHLLPWQEVNIVSTDSELV